MYLDCTYLMKYKNSLYADEIIINNNVKEKYIN